MVVFLRNVSPLIWSHITTTWGC